MITNGRIVMNFLKSILITALLTSYISCKTDHRPDIELSCSHDNSISDSLRALYLKDASLLTIRKLKNENSREFTQIDLDSNTVRSYYCALLQVYRSMSNARDSVIQMYAIHVHPDVQAYYIDLDVDSSVSPWTEWVNGNRFTGNPSIDSVIDKYNLQIHTSLLHDTNYIVELTSPSPLNAYALADFFANRHGIASSEAGGSGFGDGNNIITAISHSHMELDYSVGYGDCSSGCGARHTWTFRVYSDNSVEFIGSSGDPAPIGNYW